MLNVAICSIAIVILLLPASAHAQSWDAKALKKRDTAPATAKSSGNGMKPCPEYGAGFYRINGSATCIRIGGGIGVDVGASGARR